MAFPDFSPRARLRMAHRAVRAFGFDVIRYPPRDSFQWELLRLFERLGINCVLDVGANHGQYARDLRTWGYRGDIVSFEPVPEVFAALRQSMAGDARWRGFPWALGEVEEELAINVANDDAQASSFLPFKEDGTLRWGDAHRTERTARVPVRRLENVMSEVTAHVASPRVYLKLDTQGFDLRVVGGAGERLRDVLALQTELAAHELYEHMVPLGDALNRYRGYGYVISGIYPLSRHLDGLRMIEFDCVMVRPDAIT